MKFRLVFSLFIVLSFFSDHAMDSRMTREIVIDTNNLLDVSLCRPGLITAADVGAGGLTITMPGVYLLSENITFSPVGAASAITIASDNVQLNLQCFSITQGNAVLGVNGVEVASGHVNTLIENGSIIGLTGDGILVNDANSIMACHNVRVQQCSRGIFLNGSMASPVSKVFIEGCDLLLNDTGFSGNWVNAGSITNCTALMSAAIGFELLNSFSNKFIACNAEDTMTTTSESVYGFFVNGGAKNSFKKIYVDGTTTNATFTSDTATGFYIGPDEEELVLKLSHISNSITTLDAQAFGIQMDYTFTALNDAGLPTVMSSNPSRSNSWSSDGRYLASAVEEPASAQALILEFDGTSLAEVASFDIASRIIFDIRWSPDNNYLAVGEGTGGGPKLARVLEFNGASLTEVATFDHGTGNIISVDWSPDGRYLALGGAGVVQVRVLIFDGTSLIEVDNFAHGTLVGAVNWSPDGKYLAIGGAEGTGNFEVRVFEFNGTTLTTVANFNHGAASNVQSVDWSLDGRYLAIGGFEGSGGNHVRVLEFDGTSLTDIADFDHGGSGDIIRSVNWSADDRYLAIGGSDGAGGFEVRVLDFDGVSLTDIANYAYGDIVWEVDWNPGGNFLVLSGEPVGGINIQMLSGLQFPQNCIIMQNNVWGVHGPTVPAGMPWVSNGRGLSASSGANLIIENTAFNNDVNYVFATGVYQQFLVNVASPVPSLIDNLSFPPL